MLVSISTECPSIPLVEVFPLQQSNVLPLGTASRPHNEEQGVRSKVVLLRNNTTNIYEGN